VKIDVYPVGVLANAQRAWQYLTLPGGRVPAVTRHNITWRWRIDRAYSEIYAVYRNTRRFIRNRQWHDLRQHFNGYLAEPDPWPDGIGLTRCGRGWTRSGAIMSLYRRALAAAGPLSGDHPDLFHAIRTALRELRR
jgi:hypothetical protein